MPTTIAAHELDASAMRFEIVHIGLEFGTVARRHIGTRTRLAGDHQPAIAVCIIDTARVTTAAMMSTTRDMRPNVTGETALAGIVTDQTRMSMSRYGRRSYGPDDKDCSPQGTPPQTETPMGLRPMGAVYRGGQRPAAGPVTKGGMSPDVVLSLGGRARVLQISGFGQVIPVFFSFEVIK